MEKSHRPRPKRARILRAPANADSEWNQGLAFLPSRAKAVHSVHKMFGHSAALNYGFRIVRAFCPARAARSGGLTRCRNPDKPGLGRSAVSAIIGLEGVSKFAGTSLPAQGRSFDDVLGWWCRRDSNPQSGPGTRSQGVRVYQFRHGTNQPGVRGGSSSKRRAAPAPTIRPVFDPSRNRD